MSEQNKLEETKQPWLSKTLITAILVGIVGFIPGGKEWISAHPEITTSLVSIIMIVLRLFTDKKIQLR